MSVPTLSLSEWQQRLGADPVQGLSPAEAARRLAQDGPNALPEKQANPVLKFLSYFWGPIPWMIEVAVVLSALVGHWADFGIILVLLVINAVVGFWEEFQAGNAIAALKAKLALKAKVKRGGAWLDVPTRELVPGDLIRIRLGDIVPADAVVLTSDPIEVDQSALTGESLPVTHGQGESLYSGSILRQGECDALVSATGLKTYLGKTAELVADAKSVSHFQKAVLKIGDYLIVCALVLVAAILIAALWRGDPLLTTLQFALVLTVAAVPVAMPTVLSVTMAVGARLLARKEAIVSRLSSIEELAGMDTLCSDKTGTLTQNKLSLGEPICLTGTTPEELVLAGALASRAEDRDPIDLAVLAGVKDEKSLAAHQVLHFQPFDPVRKRTEAQVEDPDGREYWVTKGAPQVIAALAADAAARSEIDRQVAALAAQGTRALVVARADAPGVWRLLGILPLSDPPRPDSRATIAAAEAMGVGVKMVTGDQLAIARQIAGELGMGTDILDAGTLAFGDAAQTRATLKEIEGADGFAQVFPEHKYRIVAALQQGGHIVGMTGDGVNDAPALKKADCGIAVSNATDAARAAAAIVLLTPGLSVIVTAIQEARRIFQRMNAYAIYRIAETIRVLLFMTLSILAFNFYPVTAVMIVLLALLNDGAILSIAYDNAKFSNRPEAWDMRRVLGVATVLGVVGVIESFAVFFVADRYFHLSRDLIQTLIYLKLSIAGHVTVFVARTRGPFWSERPSNLLLGAVLATQILATFIAVYGLFMTPLGWKWAGLVWGYVLVWLFIEDQAKLLAYRMLAKGRN
ncbi:plasma-membrane proton-efflux P-type ATPase [Deltaproteobacteria bacterium PRO3]|nr:plasma-membrane proton-efflux P-type ATPase [Deltaproteobacteria bacterium PRO3]